MSHLSGKDFKDWINQDKNLRALYRRVLPLLTHHVENNAGREEDAQDLLQEALIVLYRKSADPDFVLTSSVDTYVFAVAKRQWLKILRRRRNTLVHHQMADDQNDPEIDEMLHMQARQNLYLKYFHTLSEGCQTLLRYFFGGTSMKEIAEKLGHGSEGYTRKRKHLCQQKLIEKIKEDPSFKELANDSSR